MHFTYFYQIRLILLLLSLILFAEKSTAKESSLVSTVEKSINKNYSVRFDIDYRAIDSELYFRLYEASLVRYFKDNLSVRLTHRWYYVHSQSAPDWKLGNMSHIRIAKNFKTDKIDYGVRLAHEYFFGNAQGNQHRTRLRFSLKPHKSFYSFKPFIANEIFYRHQRERASRNWLSTGLEYYGNKGVKYYLYHRYETFEAVDKKYWNSSHGIFGGFFYKF